MEPLVGRNPLEEMTKDSPAGAPHSFRHTQFSEPLRRGFLDRLGEEADSCKLLGGDQRMVSIHGGNGLPKVLNVAANSCLSPFAELLPPFCLNPILSCAGLKNETMKLKGLTVTRLK